jgi:hypothetical protein
MPVPRLRAMLSPGCPDSNTPDPRQGWAGRRSSRSSDAESVREPIASLLI